VREYTDFPAGGPNVGGLDGDQRLAAVSVRKPQDMTETAESLGIRRVMEFYPLTDAENGPELRGISWQEGGTGNVYVSVATLFGTGVGNQGGPVGSMTDNAGCLIRTL
jgi:hypothetical protein